MNLTATMMLASFHAEVSAAARLWRRGDLTAEAAMRAVYEALVTTEADAQAELARRDK